jgi:hypothetical protein
MIFTPNRNNQETGIMKTISTPLAILQLFLMVCASCGQADGQSRKERDSLGITEIEYYEVDYMDSNGKEYLEKIERFDERGELIEEIKYDLDGGIKEHIQYVYDGKFLMKEIYLDHKGNVDKTYVYEYDPDGLRISKKYFDNKDRIYKEKRYRYKK